MSEQQSEPKPATVGPTQSPAPHPLATERQAHIDPSTLAPGISKNAAKRAARKAYYESTKAIRRKADKQRRKAKAKSKSKSKSKSKPELEPESESESEAQSQIQSEGRERKVRKPVGARLLIDLAFDQLMSEKEQTSLAQQLMYVYAANRASTAPFDRIIFTGPDSGSENDSEINDLFSSSVGRAMEGKLRGVWHSWTRVDLHRWGGLSSIVKRGTSKLVYLTADTDVTLTTLEDDTIYILGGIVDKNRYKSLCLDRATKLGIPVAKLPIHQDTLQHLASNSNSSVFKGRKVLTVNQVAEILIAFNESNDWSQALSKSLPKRKLKPSSTASASLDPNQESLSHPTL